eukprot:TRINITY_DN12314_c0_g1_i1.p1 TRINITY_DN12314_c0_g1~~TRINITY_DN12314_c0_g1_i1.p1  ORF type:complete len:151 (+),score=15.41 TRINITY_DN12314_c0_g1_i1:34-453(+)
MTQQDSIFKNISLPGGISTKATEYKDLAAKGDKWESPVFSIGSASESTTLPKATAVARKPHQTRTGGVRGSNHPSISSASGQSANLTTQSFPQGSGGFPQGTQSIPGTSSAATGLNAEMDQAFKAGNTGATFHDATTQQ